MCNIQSCIHTLSQSKDVQNHVIEFTNLTIKVWAEGAWKINDMLFSPVSLKIKGKRKHEIQW